MTLDPTVTRKWERRNAALSRPSGQELDAFEREERLAEHYGDMPMDEDREAETAWQDRLADEGEDRTLTGDLPAGYDSRCFGGIDG